MTADPAPSPVGAALDVLLYAPVGLLLAVGEEVPKLAAKGRQRLAGQMSTARVIGEFAVVQGRREAAKLATHLSEASRARAATPGSEAGTPDPGAGPPAAGASEVAGPDAAPPHAAPARRRSRAAAAARQVDGPSPEGLAIPGYDSLSASQVVSRLAGLSGPELAAVRDYESATRGRRTILTRIAQLQGS